MMRLIRKIGIFGSGILLVGLSGYTFAAGTNAGTSVTNLATLSFQVGGVDQTPVESSEAGNSTPGLGNGTSTDFVVDRALDLTVTSIDATAVAVAPGANTGAVVADYLALEFTVENTGNAVQNVALQAVNAAAAPAAYGVGADAFDPTATTFTYYLDDGGTVGALDATDTLIVTTTPGGAGLAVPVLVDQTPDTPVTVFVVAEIPASGSPGIAADAVAAISLVATVAEPTTDDAIAGNLGTAGDLILTDDAGTTDDTATTDDVFADGAATEAGVDGSFDFTGATPNLDAGDDTAGNGQTSATSAYIIATANISVSKAVETMCDDASLIADPKAVPGSVQRYTITVINNSPVVGGTSATLTQLEDIIPTNTALTVMRDYSSATTEAVCTDFAALDGADNEFRAGCTDAAGGSTAHGVCEDASAGDYTYFAQGGAVGIDSNGTAAGNTITVCYDNQLATGSGLDCSGLAGGEVVLQDDAGGSGAGIGELAPQEAVIIEFDVIVQ